MDEYHYKNGVYCGKKNSEGYIYDYRHREVGKQHADGRVYDNAGRLRGHDWRSILKCPKN